MVRSGEEKDRFRDLKPVFMSEESDPDENDTIEVKYTSQCGVHLVSEGGTLIQ